MPGIEGHWTSVLLGGGDIGDELKTVEYIFRGGWRAAVPGRRENEADDGRAPLTEALRSQRRDEWIE